MDLTAVISKVDQILITEFELEPDAVVPDATLREDLDLDSLDAVDLVVALEKEFAFRVSNDMLKEVRKVSDIHDMVRVLWAQKMEETQPAAAEASA